MSQRRKSARRIEETIGRIQKNFECPICLDLMKNPVSTRCDHKFCRHCILETVGKKQKVPCPLCKELFTKRSLQTLPQWNQIVTTVANLVRAFEMDSGILRSPTYNFLPASPSRPSSTKRSKEKDTKGFAFPSTSAATSQTVNNPIEQKPAQTNTRQTRRKLNVRGETKPDVVDTGPLNKKASFDIDKTSDARVEKEVLIEREIKNVPKKKRKLSRENVLDCPDESRKTEDLLAYLADGSLCGVKPLPGDDNANGLSLETEETSDQMKRKTRSNFKVTRVKARNSGKSESDSHDPRNSKTTGTNGASDHRSLKEEDEEIVSKILRDPLEKHEVGSTQDNPSIKPGVKQKIEKWFNEQETPSSLAPTSIDLGQNATQRASQIECVENRLDLDIEDEALCLAHTRSGGFTKEPLGESGEEGYHTTEEAEVFCEDGDAVDEIIEVVEDVKATNRVRRTNERLLDAEDPTYICGDEMKAKSSRRNSRKCNGKKQPEVESGQMYEFVPVLFDLSQKSVYKKVIEEQCHSDEQNLKAVKKKPGQYEPQESTLKPVTRTYGQTLTPSKARRSTEDASFSQAKTPTKAGPKFFVTRGKKRPEKLPVQVVEGPESTVDPYAFKVSQEKEKKGRKPGRKRKKGEMVEIELVPTSNRSKAEKNGKKTSDTMNNAAADPDAESQTELESLVEKISEAEEHDLVFSQQVRDMAEEYRMEVTRECTALDPEIGEFHPVSEVINLGQPVSTPNSVEGCVDIQHCEPVVDSCADNSKDDKTHIQENDGKVSNNIAYKVSDDRENVDDEKNMWPVKKETQGSASVIGPTQSQEGNPLQTEPIINVAKSGAIGRESPVAVSREGGKLNSEEVKGQDSIQLKKTRSSVRKTLVLEETTQRKSKLSRTQHQDDWTNVKGMEKDLVPSRKVLRMKESSEREKRPKKSSKSKKGSEETKIDNDVMRDTDELEGELVIVSDDTQESKDKQEVVVLGEEPTTESVAPDSSPKKDDPEAMDASQTKSKKPYKKRKVMQKSDEQTPLKTHLRSSKRIGKTAVGDQGSPLRKKILSEDRSDDKIQDPNMSEPHAENGLKQNRSPAGSKGEDLHKAELTEDHQTGDLEGDDHMDKNVCDEITIIEKPEVNVSSESIIERLEPVVCEVDSGTSRENAQDEKKKVMESKALKGSTQPFQGPALDDTGSFELMGFVESPPRPVRSARKTFSLKLRSPLLKNQPDACQNTDEDSSLRAAATMMLASDSLKDDPMIDRISDHDSPIKNSVEAVLCDDGNDEVTVVVGRHEYTDNRGASVGQGMGSNGKDTSRKKLSQETTSPSGSAPRGKLRNSGKKLKSNIKIKPGIHQPTSDSDQSVVMLIPELDEIVVLENLSNESKEGKSKPGENDPETGRHDPDYETLSEVSVKCVSDIDTRIITPPEGIAAGEKTTAKRQVKRHLFDSDPNNIVRGQAKTPQNKIKRSPFKSKPSNNCSDSDSSSDEEIRRTATPRTGRRAVRGLAMQQSPNTKAEITKVNEARNRKAHQRPGEDLSGDSPNECLIAFCEPNFKSDSLTTAKKGSKKPPSKLFIPGTPENLESPSKKSFLLKGKSGTSATKSPLFRVKDTPAVSRSPARRNRNLLYQTSGSMNAVTPSVSVVEETPIPVQGRFKCLEEGKQYEDTETHSESILLPPTPIIERSKSTRGLSRSMLRASALPPLDISVVDDPSGSNEIQTSMMEVRDPDEGLKEYVVKDTPVIGEDEIKEEPAESPVEYIDEEGRTVWKSLPTDKEHPVEVEDRDFQSREEMDAVLKNLAEDEDVSQKRDREEPFNVMDEEGSSENDLILPSLEERKKHTPRKSIIKESRECGEVDDNPVETTEGSTDALSDEEVVRPRKKSVRNVIEDDISDDEGDIDSDSSVISRNLTSSSVYSSQSELGGTEREAELKSDVEVLRAEILKVEAELEAKNAVDVDVSVHDGDERDAYEDDVGSQKSDLEGEQTSASRQSSNVRVTRSSDTKSNYERNRAETVGSQSEGQNQEPHDNSTLAIPDSLTENPQSMTVPDSLNERAPSPDPASGDDAALNADENIYSMITGSETIHTNEHHNKSHVSCSLPSTYNETMDPKANSTPTKHGTPVKSQTSPTSSPAPPTPPTPNTLQSLKNVNPSRSEKLDHLSSTLTKYKRNTRSALDMEECKDVKIKSVRVATKKRKLDMDGAEGSAAKSVKLDEDAGIGDERKSDSANVPDSPSENDTANNASERMNTSTSLKSKMSQFQYWNSPNVSSAGGSPSSIGVEFPQKPDWCFVLSGTKKPKIKMLVQKFQKKIGAKDCNHMTSAVTHLIVTRVEASGDHLMCERTLKYFQAIAGRKWIVSSQWVEDSLKIGQLLPEEEYEIHGDTMTGALHDGPRKSRLHGGKLFAKTEMCCMSDYNCVKKDQLRELIEQCGGSTVQHPSMFSFDRKKQRFIIVDSEGQSDTTRLSRLYKQYEVPIVGKDWVLESIGRYSLQRHRDYALSLT